MCKVRSDSVSISVDEVGRTSGAVGAFGKNGGHGRWVVKEQ